MPCFLAGVMAARSAAAALDVPCYAVSHQQGHVAAALWSAGRLELMDRPHLAWHLSGGTTELLLVEPEGANVKATKLGGTSDISAGQVMDRTGKLLELPFPAGKAFGCAERDRRGQALPGQDRRPHVFLFWTGESDPGLLSKDRQRRRHRGLRHRLGGRRGAAADSGGPGPVPGAGGGLLRRRGSNRTLRKICPFGVFAAPQFSTDNAMGVAILGRRLLEAGAAPAAWPAP